MNATITFKRNGNAKVASINLIETREKVIFGKARFQGLVCVNELKKIADDFCVTAADYRDSCGVLLAHSAVTMNGRPISLQNAGDWTF